MYLYYYSQDTKIRQGRVRQGRIQDFSREVQEFHASGKNFGFLGPFHGSGGKTLAYNKPLREAAKKVLFIVVRPLRGEGGG